MRIGVVHVTTEAASGPYTELISANLERVKSADTEIVHKYVSHMRRATDTAIIYPTLLNKVDIVTQIVALADEGVDAVFVACSGDPAVDESRTLVDIPVVGPLEATMGLACGYGRHVGIVTVADLTWAGQMRSMAEMYGLGDRFVGVRRLQTPTMEIFTKGFEQPELVGEEIAARCLELVEIDGAESIIVGSAGLSTFASRCGLSRVEPYDVPIFDCMCVGLKVAELRASLQLKLGVPAVGRSGIYGRYSDADRQRVDTLFGWER
jgi:Asp/Glu/hydantoin racemase